MCLPKGEYWLVSVGTVQGTVTSWSRTYWEWMKHRHVAPLNPTPLALSCAASSCETYEHSQRGGEGDGVRSFLVSGVYLGWEAGGQEGISHSGLALPASLAQAGVLTDLGRCNEGVLAGVIPASQRELV